VGDDGITYTDVQSGFIANDRAADPRAVVYVCGMRLNLPIMRFVEQQLLSPFAQWYTVQHQRYGTQG
jgi:hypothetical protein